MTLIQAFIQNTGSPEQMQSERHKWTISTRPNSEAVKDDGWCCISDETRCRKVCRELLTVCKVRKCCIKDGSRPTTVAVQAEAVNHLPAAASVLACGAHAKYEVTNNVISGPLGTALYLAGGDKWSYVGALGDGLSMSFGGNGAPGVFPTQINRTDSYKVEPIEWHPFNGEPEPVLNLNIKIRPAGMSAMEWGNQLHYDKFAGGTGDGLPTQLKLLYPETDFIFTGRGVKGPDVKVTGGKKPWEYPGSTWKRGNLFGDFKTIKDTKFNGEVKSGKLPQNTQKLTYDPSTGQLQK